MMTAADTPGGGGVVGGGGMMPGSPPSKASLISWWKNFSKKGAKPSDKEDLSKGSKPPPVHIPSVPHPLRQFAYHPLFTEKPGIFGVPLRQSIEYANVAISLTDANGNSFIYGYVPIVVAKCGVFLKERGWCIPG